MKYDRNPRLDVEAGDRLNDEHECVWIIQEYETRENEEVVHAFCESGPEEGEKETWAVDELHRSLVDGIMWDDEGRSHELVKNF